MSEFQSFTLSVYTECETHISSPDFQACVLDDKGSLHQS